MKEKSTKLAVFPGTFDPFTLGHLDIVEQSLQLFDNLHILIALHPAKRHWLSVQERENLIQTVLQKRGLANNVQVHSWSGLLVDYLKENECSHVVRSFRNGQDADYEMGLSWINQSLSPEYSPIYFSARQNLAHISSSVVRELARHQKMPENLVPAEIVNLLPITKTES